MTDIRNQVEKEVRETVQAGTDIYERVRAITLKALTERELDMENIKSVVESVLKGIGDGVNSHFRPAKEVFTQSADALDDALQKTAQASALAIEEAASRIKEFSESDMNRAAEDLKSLEEMFLQTIEKMARDSNETVTGIAQDFIAHARQSGTAVGRQTQFVLENLTNLQKKEQDAIVSGAVATTTTLAKIASGILSGIAESLHHKNPEN